MGQRVLRVVAAAGIAAAAALIALSAATGPLAVASTHPCEPGDLEVVLGSGGAGLGHWSETLLIVDPGGRACSFRGYPTVRAFDGTSRRWVVATRTPSGYLGGLRSGQPIHTVSLDAYTVASVMVEGTDVPVGGGSTCPTFVRMTVALPGWRPSANLSVAAPACSTPEVHPLVAGATGDQPPDE